MDIKKLAPWNWFKDEEESSTTTVPIARPESPASLIESSHHPMIQLHREMDRLFENAFRGFGMSPYRTDFPSASLAGFMKPQVDVAASDKEYTITVEVPGVNEKDVKVEIAGNAMTIRGEKKQEKKEREKDYYCMERSYGSFQRILSLPDDADEEKVKAEFRKGVLNITIPRKALPQSEVKKIEIKGVEE
ncbi:Hsp20/alpha crystallin family protein [Desulfopila sp. IMCC35008]|uniref:Hsp20/alpha crystallin family protein n=1 Tax=Desulfopila sp. IMCC35008 TaxID=2653858 RepID=UPI0013D3F745|nr:Hsp20/alpha crystallin family protein [Desulfopila sp. IMCC35008]